MTPRGRGRTFAVMLLALAASGCISVGGDAPLESPRRFDLRPDPPGPPVVAAGPEVISLDPFTCDPAADGEEMAWERGEVEAGRYASYLWARPPAEAVRDLCAAALARSGACAVVATEPAAAAPDYVLRAHVARLAEREDGDAWAGVFELRVSLSAGGRWEVLRRTYVEREVATERNPRGSAAALRRAIGRAAERLAEDVAAILERRRVPPSPPTE